MKKSIIAGFLALCILITAFSGCTQSGGESTDASTAPPDTTSTAPSEETPATEEPSGSTGEAVTMPLSEPMTIKFLLGGNESIVNDGKLAQAIKEQTNVQFDFQITPTEYATKRNAMLASNDIPDVFWGELSNIKQYGSTGMFLNLMDYEEYMPNFMGLISAEDREKESNVLYLDGALYSFARLEKFRVPVGTMPMIRMDVLEDNNLPVPTTYDELFDTFVALKEIYPDRYFMSARQGTNYMVGQIAYPLGGGGFPGFLKENAMYYEPNQDKYLYGPTQESFKTVLEYLNKMYTAGLIDPDYASLTEDMFKQKCSNGTYLFYFDNNSHAADNYNRNLQEKEPNARFEMLDPLTNSYGEARGYLYQKDWLERNNLIINAKVERPAEVVSFFDWFYSEEGSLTLNFGVEGESYVIEDGTVKIAQPMWDEFPDYPRDNNAILNEINKYMGGLSIFTLYLDESWKVECAQPSFLEMGDRLLKLAEEDKVQYLNNDMMLLFTTEETDKLSTLQANTLTVFNSNIDKFITGTRSLDEFDSFVEELKGQGAEEIESIYNAAYDRMR